MRAVDPKDTEKNLGAILTKLKAAHVAMLLLGMRAPRNFGPEYAAQFDPIYPRLARLEEDGLVTHEEVDGKKVYSITDKGREEIHSRLSDLADLEDELNESLRDVAREISEDVRDTVRSIREELSAAAREFRAGIAVAAGAGAEAGNRRRETRTVP